MVVPGYVRFVQHDKRAGVGWGGLFGRNTRVSRQKRRNTAEFTTVEWWTASLPGLRSVLRLDAVVGR